MEADEDLKRVKAAVSLLAEHFDTVQVFTTRYESAEEGTIQCNSGQGNWYARRGQVQEWLTREDEDTRENVRKKDEE